MSHSQSGPGVKFPHPLPTGLEISDDLSQVTVKMEERSGLLFLQELDSEGVSSLLEAIGRSSGSLPCLCPDLLVSSLS